MHDDYLHNEEEYSGYGFGYGTNFFFLNISFVIDGLSTQRTSEFTYVSQ